MPYLLTLLLGAVATYLTVCLHEHIVRGHIRNVLSLLAIGYVGLVVPLINSSHWSWWFPHVLVLIAVFIRIYNHIRLRIQKAPYGFVRYDSAVFAGFASGVFFVGMLWPAVDDGNPSWLSILLLWSQSLATIAFCANPLQTIKIIRKKLEDVSYISFPELLGVVLDNQTLVKSDDDKERSKQVSHIQHAIEQLIDEGLFTAFELDGVEWFFRTELILACVSKIGTYIQSRGIVPSSEIESIFQQSFPACPDITIKRVLEQSMADFKVMTLGGQVYYVSSDILEKTQSKIETALNASVRMSRYELSGAIVSNEITHEVVHDFIDQCEGAFENLQFEDGRYFVAHSHMDQIGICPTCGIAKIVEPEALQKERYFCCDYCRETEDQISELTKTIKKNKLISAGVSNAAIGAILGDVGHAWDYNKGRAASLSGKGHGLVAEDANTMLDRLTGHNASVIGTDNAKNGPDRIVDGQLIQTKYCHSAWASVNDAFKGDGTYRYMVDGKPIQLEVPRDQYDLAIKEMEKRIKDGKIPGVTDPKEASSLIRKGWLTYEQAQNICKFGTVESVLFDSYTGAIIGITAGGISFALTTALNYWRTGDLKKSLRGAVVIAAQTGGKAFTAYLIGAQAQKIPAVKNFLDSAIRINFGGHGKAVKTVGDGLSKMAGKTKFNNAAANSAVKGAVVTAVATFAVTSIWEIGCWCNGRMSGMQCFKNVVVGGVGIAAGTATGLYGAAIGTTICPVIGTLIGGLVGGFVGSTGGSYIAKKGMDLVGEDDVDYIMPLVQSQIQVLAIMFCLSKDDLGQVMSSIDEYIQGHSSFVSDVFSHRDYRRQYITRIFKPMFARAALERPMLRAQDISADAVERALSEQ